MMPSIGTPEIIIILAIALILFGPSKLPEIGKSLGQGLRELRKASREIMSTIEDDDDDRPPARASNTVSAPSEDTASEEDMAGDDAATQAEKESSDNAAASTRNA